MKTIPDEANRNICWVEDTNGSRPTFKTFTNAVDTECWEELGVSIYDLCDIDYYGHYSALPERPTWHEWDVAVTECLEDLKAENGVDW
tara:strand:+ start:787 stop:1050 length:264 start_codon:yes stop_codon:yes gene_type:complete